MARPVVAYVLTVAVGAWAFRAVQLWQQGDAPVRAVIESVATLVGLGPIYLAAFAVLLVPALVLTIEVVHRFEVDSRAGRAVVGALSFGSWCLFGATALAVFSRVVLVPEWLVGAIVVFAVSGGAFSLFAFDQREIRPGIALKLLAMLVVAFVILGGVWMAGRWGGTA
jgi:hypothetical protein